MMRLKYFLTSKHNQLRDDIEKNLAKYAAEHTWIDSVFDERFDAEARIEITLPALIESPDSSKDIDNVTALANVLKISAENVKSELFTDGEKYRLIIRSDFAINRKLDAIVCEYCDICDESVTAHTYEHWKLLASPDAIGVLDALY